MESNITENIWCVENRPIEVNILLSLDPYDWYELKETDAWKEVERLVKAFGNRDNLLCRLEALDLKERATSEQVQTALHLAHPEAFDKSQQTDTGSTEPFHHPIWQRLKKWIRG